jgi:hypothetical protein
VDDHRDPAGLGLVAADRPRGTSGDLGEVNVTAAYSAVDECSSRLGRLSGHDPGDCALLAGITIGILIGITSGVVFLLLLRTASRWSGAASILPLTSELLAIPTFWFGGPWLTTRLLGGVSLTEMLNPYLVTLVITFTIILIYPAFHWIVRLGQEFAEGQG